MRLYIIPETPCQRENCALGGHFEFRGGSFSGNNICQNSARERRGNDYWLTKTLESSPHGYCVGAIGMHEDIIPKVRTGDSLSRVRQWVLCLASLAFAERISGQTSFGQDELRTLPRVCHAQKFINEVLRPPIVSEQERRQWESRLGEYDYSGFHHHCYALMYIRRASTETSAQSREYNYVQAVNNFLFVQNHASRKFPLMPEVNLRKGQTLRLLGRDAEAAKEFLDAISLKPDYSPAYAALVELYLDLKDLQAADQILTKGLENAPRSKILLQKRIDLEAVIQATR